MKRLVYVIQCPPFWLKTPPLNLACLKAYLKSKGFGVKTLDLNLKLFDGSGLNQKQWLKLDEDFEKNLFLKIKKSRPDFISKLIKKLESSDFIGFSLFKRNKHFTFSLAKEIKEKLPSKKIIIGGPETLFLDRKNKIPKEYSWVIGEGELALEEILNGKNKKIIRFKEISDLDSLPFPEFDMASYLSLPLITSRGCPYQCSFCSEKLLAQRFRFHSASYIIDTLEYLKKKHKVNNFVFCDSLINYKISWLKDFCEKIVKKNLNIKWEAQIRVDENLDLSLAKLIKKSGCYNLFIGLESASDNVLRLMNKGFKIKEAKQFLNNLNKAGLHFEISLITGYPEESQNDFKETLDFLKTNKKILPKIAQVNPFCDYLKNFPEKSFPTPLAKKRTRVLLQTIKRLGLRYTKSFINNLTYN